MKKMRDSDKSSATTSVHVVVYCICCGECLVDFLFGL